jgi:hypothetical protein
MRDRSSYTLPIAALGAAPDDVVLLFAFATSGTFATPPGFGVIASGSNNPGTTFLVYYKRLGATVDTAVTITNGAATPPSYSAAALVVFRNVRTVGDPFSVQLGTVSAIDGVASEPQISFTAPSVFVSTPGVYHVVAFFYEESGGGETWVASPAGMVKLVDGQELGIFGQLLTATGATGTRVANASWITTNGVEGGAWVGALAPQ